MAAFTPFHIPEDIGKEDVLVVCSYGPDNDTAVQEIEQWSREHGYVRGGEHTLNVRRNLNGHKYFYSACYLKTKPNDSGVSKGPVKERRDKNIVSSSGTLMREQTAERGTELYEQHIRPKVESGNFGKYVAVDVRADVSLDYEIGSDLMTAAERILTRRPDAILYTVRVGYPAVATLRHREMRSSA